MGVQLLSNTMQSMPSYTELDESETGSYTDIKQNQQKQETLEEKSVEWHRTMSNHTETSTDEYIGPKVANCGSLVNATTVVKASNNNGNGSMVNVLLCSDVGPSASVIAAAVARGLIKSPTNVAPLNNAVFGGSITDDWTENKSIEGLRTKIERWRTELPPVLDNDRRKLRSGSRGRKKGRGQMMRRRREGDHGGLFSCFGNIFGCEISITCGGGHSKKKRYGKGIW